MTEHLTPRERMFEWTHNPWLQAAFVLAGTVAGHFGLPT